MVTAAGAALPGLGHVLLGRRRTGAAILGTFLLGTAVMTLAVARTDGAELLRRSLSDATLTAVIAACAVVALAWTATILWTWSIARPRPLSTGRRVVGAGAVAVLCAVVALPPAAVAVLARSQQVLLDSVLVPGPVTRQARQSAADGPDLPPRLNILLLGSDAGPDREGLRTDTMILASVDTRTADTILFALPRNIEDAPFPPGSPAAARFPHGYPSLLNDVYGYGVAHPDLAPAGPTADPGVNLLMSSVSQLLGVPVQHHVMIGMDGLAAVVDALGGVTVDVGPEPLPIGGVTYSGRHVRPDGYVPAGVQHLDGYQALWFARSRRDADDYARMARQRCLISAIVTQNGPAELLLRFRSVAAATAGSVTTDIPRDELASLVTLVEEHYPPRLRTVSFDPHLPDPNQPGRTFRPAHPDLAFVRDVVRQALAPPVPASTTSPGAGTAPVAATIASPTPTPSAACARPAAG
jgi:LCP family protein required for cell wall assembly